jgi:hypothetical protein
MKNPSTKFQISNKLQSSKFKIQQSPFWSFDIGAWDLFGIWDLEFGISEGRNLE